MANPSPPTRRRSGGSALAGARLPQGGDDPGREVGPEVPKLVCVAGPAAGVEYPLMDVEVVVGRSADNPVSIPDTSVSRKHVRLRDVGDGWVCEDLGSGNGTLLNGDPVEGERMLRTGDVITLGDTELSFVGGPERSIRALPRRRSLESEGVSVRRARASSRADVRARLGRGLTPAESPLVLKRKRRVKRLIFLFFVLVVGVLGGLKWLQTKEQEKAARQAVLFEEQRQQLGALFQEGKNLVRDGKWQEAKERFLAVKAKAPAYPAIDQFLEKAEKEIPNERLLDAARLALSQGKLSEAAKALTQVAPQTQLYEPLRELTTQLEDKVELRLKDAQRSLTAVRPGAAGKQDLQDVKGQLEDLLLARPEHRDAKVLLTETDARLAAFEKQPVKRRAKAGMRPWDRAVEEYLDGNLDSAIDSASSCTRKIPRCRTLVRELRAFSELNGRVEKLDSKGLSRLLALDRKISPAERGPLAKTAATRAAGIHYKSAAAAKAAGQWGKAMLFAKRTLEADSAHGGALAMVEEIRAKAKDVFLLGYSLKDQQPEEALGRFREVLQMTTTDDEYHAKATHWIRQLDK